MNRALQIYKLPQGRAPSIWISTIKNDRKKLNISWDGTIEPSANKN